MTRAWRWLIPLSALPVLVLLWYGFKLNPRDIPSPLVGKTAAPFTLTTFEGQPLSLEALRGRVIVINFWASWCHPACYEEAPALERGQAGFERGARGIAAARVLEAAMLADGFLGEGHRLVDRDDGRAGRLVGLLAGVDGARLEAQIALSIARSSPAITISPGPATPSRSSMAR